MKNSIRKKWFKVIKGFLRIFIRKTKFVYLGQQIEGPSIILSNHSAASGPLGYELYFPKTFRFWGTHEMNEGLISTYKYLTNTYYHKKKHWNIHLARLFCIIAAPLCNLFYKGLNLISTYQDTRFRRTLRDSLKTLKDGHNLIIFPEASENGYFKELTLFHEGFVVFLEYCKKHLLNLPVYVAYFRSDDKMCVLDHPVMMNELLGLGLTRQELANKLKERCNELGLKLLEDLK